MKLKKQLNAIEVFSIASGAMISSGLFVLPAIAYKEAIENSGVGIPILFAYFFAGVLMLPSLFTKLELATAIPKAGGTYFFSGAGFSLRPYTHYYR
jgi:amino acid transporter